MKISAFVLVLSMLANLSFASFNGEPTVGQANLEDTVNRESLKLSLVGEWTKVSQDEYQQGFSDLCLFADGKFKGHTADGKRVCGKWEISSDGIHLAFHKTCEKTGDNIGTMLVEIEMVDGHMLTLKSIGAGGDVQSQTFIQ